MTKHSQRGYYNFDFTGTLTTLLVVGVVSGVALTKLVEWVWPFIKAFIHQVTA
jgi:hypothetical protein